MSEDKIHQNPNPKPEEDEIDLIALAKNLWNGRKFIIKVVLVFMVLGLVIALLTPKQYSASSTLVPQTSQAGSKLGGLSGLAAMAGFNINMSESVSELSPRVYPQIVQSVPFQLEIMNTPFRFAEIENPVSLFEYYTELAKPGILSQVKKYTIGLPFVILKAIKGEKQEDSSAAKGQGSAFQLSKEQEEVRKLVAGNVSLSLNDKEGYVELNTVFHEANLAAQVAQKAQDLLQQYITEYKIEKASAQLDFIEERYKEKKEEFEKAQANLAAFRDRNKNVTSAMARTEEERLQNEYQLAFEVYSSLAQQLEQARIKVKEDTPVFAIIKPVTVPLEDNTSGLMTLIIWTFLGVVIAVGWVFGKQYLATVKKRWKEV